MTDRHRQHGVIDAASVRTVGMTPDQARQVIREEEDLRYPLRASSLEPPVVTVRAGDPVGTLANGLGANWSPAHQGEEAYPEADDEAGWQRFLDGMTEAGIRWVRYWLQPTADLVPGPDIDVNHRFLHRFDRLQAWAAANDATIMLELSTVPPAYQFSDVYDAPRDNARYVREYIVPLVRHVVVDRGGDRIRQLCLFNEPFNADVSPFIFAPEPPRDALLHYLELHEILRAALDAAGLAAIGLIGPNSANMFQRHLEMYEDKGLGDRVAATFAELDCHMWRLRFDYYPPSKRWPGYGMSEGIRRYLRPTLAAAARLGKRLSLTEVGSMYFNEQPTTDRNTRHDAFLVMAEQLVRAVNEGIAGAMIWCYNNSGRIDGQWGWIGTRATGFAPVPNLLNGFATLMRPQRVGATIHHCEAAESDFSAYVAAALTRAADGTTTVWLVNDHPTQRLRVRLALPPNSPTRFAALRKDFAPQRQDLGAVDAVNGELVLELPGMTLTSLVS